jgi:hypothetical protein
VSFFRNGASTCIAARSHHVKIPPPRDMSSYRKTILLTSMTVLARPHSRSICFQEHSPTDIVQNMKIAPAAQYFGTNANTTVLPDDLATSDSSIDYNPSGVGKSSLEKAQKEPAAGTKKKPFAARRRVVQSCSECRRRKIKCDKK